MIALPRPGIKPVYVQEGVLTSARLLFESLQTASGKLLTSKADVIKPELNKAEVIEDQPKHHIALHHVVAQQKQDSSHFSQQSSASEEKDATGLTEDPFNSAEAQEVKVSTSKDRAQSLILLESIISECSSGFSCTLCKNFKQDLGGRIDALQWQALVDDDQFYQISFESPKMQVEDYDTLLDLGFIRCGTQFYKRSHQKSCCETYEYHVHPEKYTPSRSQKRVVKRFFNYLNYGTRAKEDQGPMTKARSKQKDDHDGEGTQAMDRISSEVIDLLASDVKQFLEEVLPSHAEGISAKHKVTLNKKHRCLSSNLLMVHKSGRSEEELSKLEDKLKQALPGGISKQTTSLKIVKTPSGAIFINFELAEALVLVAPENLKPKPCKKIAKIQPPLQLPAIISNQRSNKEFTKFFGPDPAELYYKPVLSPSHSYTIEVVPAVLTKEIFDVFCAYEWAAHGREIEDEDYFADFLCNSPLYQAQQDPYIVGCSPPENLLDLDLVYKRSELPLKNPIFSGLGSRFMLHRIDGDLAAVGVLDLTPKYLVSMYLFYNPKFKQLRFGTLSGVMELRYARHLQQTHVPGLEFYSMMGYSRSCKKLKYKEDFLPGFLLCPQTGKRVPFKEASPRAESLVLKTSKEKETMDLSQLSLMPGPMAFPPLSNYELVQVLKKQFEDRENGLELLTALWLSETFREFIKLFYSRIGLQTALRLTYI